MVGQFKARTFDELFEQTKALNWGDYLPVDAQFLYRENQLNLNCSAYQIVKAL